VLKWLTNISGKRTKLVVGLMSGTSLDGIDAALVRVEGSGMNMKAELVAYRCDEYPAGLREKLKEMCTPGMADVQDICAMNVYLARQFAASAAAVAEDAGMRLSEVDLIASHGQTIWHLPIAEGEGESPFHVPSTLQIGDISVIAKLTGVPVVGDYRPADMALGGQGAPLTPYADYILCRHPEKGRILQNIGGIGNCTVVPANARAEQIFAFDTGPGNMAIDQAVVRLTNGALHYDKGGAMADAGKPNEMVLAEMIKHPYFAKEPMKTTGREMFGKTYADEWIDRMLADGMAPNDIVATFTAFTALTIADSYRAFIMREHAIDEVIVSGGGAKNGALMRMLQELLPETRVAASEAIGIDGDAKEALAFALMGAAFIDGEPNNLSKVTGASRATVMGKLAMP